MIREKAKEKQIASGGAVCQKSEKPVCHTDEELAKTAGVSRDTIRKVETIKKEVKSIERRYICPVQFGPADRGQHSRTSACVQGLRSRKGL